MEITAELTPDVAQLQQRIERFQTVRDGIGIFKIWCQHFGVARAGFRISLQFTIGDDRWRIRIFQIDWIEIERQVEQQR